MKRVIDFQTVKNAVIKLLVNANYDLDDDVIIALERASVKEEGLSKTILNEILDNAKIAKDKKIPICQDTGIVVVFLEIGYNLCFNFLIDDAINEGIKEAYENFFFRMSVVRDPLDRKNTNTNTPAIIHTQLVPGDKLKIIVCPKGAGSENLSQIKMLSPSDGIKGIKDFIITATKNAGGKICPPGIVGIGIGGNFETCALLSKKALLRPLNDVNDNPILQKLEKEIYNEINNLGIGPMGIGGVTTTLAVKICTAPCHIASLPVAINFQCHASRHKEVVI